MSVTELKESINDIFTKFIVKDVELWATTEAKQKALNSEYFGSPKCIEQGSINVVEQLTNKLTRIEKTLPNGGKVWLGDVVNWDLVNSEFYNRRLKLKSDWLRKLCEYDMFWVPFAEKIQTLEEEGKIDYLPVSYPAYESAFENNVKLSNDPEVLQKYAAVLTSYDDYLLLEDDRGIEKPDILRGWRIQDIPETTHANMFSMRDKMLKRPEREAPINFFTDMFRYVYRHFDHNFYPHLLWLSYLRDGDWFTIYKGNLVVEKSLLAHKRFEMAFYASRAVIKFACDDEMLAVINEYVSQAMVDPIYYANKLKTAFGDINQHAMSLGTNTQINTISIAGLETADFKLMEDANRYDPTVRVHLVDYKLVKDAVDKVRLNGLPMTAKLLNDSLRYRVSKMNAIKSRLNRILLGLTGYSGSHPDSAIVNQFISNQLTADPHITDEMRAELRSIMSEVFTLARAHSMLRFTPDRYDVLFKGGTSASASADVVTKLKATATFTTRLLSQKRAKTREYFRKTRNGEYAVKKQLSYTLKDKNSNIITDPENYFKYDQTTIDNKEVNVGSRQVRGIRIERIITPNAPEIYNVMLQAALPFVRLLSGRVPGSMVLDFKGRVGTAYGEAIAHVIVAPAMAVLTNDPSYFTAAFDFGQFDTSQWGEIADAHAEGVQLYANTLPLYRAEDYEKVLDLSKISDRKMAELLAKYYRSSTKYKSRTLKAKLGSVRSGELTTQGRNTVTNLAHTRLTIARYNALVGTSGRLIVLVVENLVGDDKLLIFRMLDGKPFTIEVATKLLEAASQIAKENHLELSAKRTLVSNKSIEHIKLFMTDGKVMHDVFLDVLTSEKNSFRSQPYIERRNTVYDILMTMLLRFGTTNLITELMISDLCDVEGVKAHDLEFIPNLKSMSVAGSPEIALSTPELRGMGRYLYVDGDEEHGVLSSLNNTLSSSSGYDEFKRKLIADSTDGLKSLVSDTWNQHFKRRRSIFNQEQFDRLSRKDKRLEGYLPEYSWRVLRETIFKSKTQEPSIQYINNEAVLTTILFKAKLPTRTKEYAKYRFNLSRSVTYAMKESPYISATNEVQLVHRIIGLSDDNSELMDSTSRLERRLKSLIGAYPAYLSGDNLLGILSNHNPDDFIHVLELLDFSPAIISEIANFAKRLMYRYQEDKDLNKNNVFDNTSITYDFSYDNMNSRVDLMTLNTRARDTKIKYLFEGMKQVVYMASKGYSVKASLE